MLKKLAPQGLEYFSFKPICLQVIPRDTKKPDTHQFLVGSTKCHTSLPPSTTNKQKNLVQDVSFMSL